jgi:hypothetical protein
VQLLDRTGDNLQAKRNDTDGPLYFERLLHKVSPFVRLERSSFYELPVEFPEMLFDYDSKVEWLRREF